MRVAVVGLGRHVHRLGRLGQDSFEWIGHEGARKMLVVGGVKGRRVQLSKSDGACGTCAMAEKKGV